MDLKSAKVSVLNKVLRDNYTFIIPFIMSTSLMTVLLATVGNDRLFLDINSCHSAFADFFFLNFTNLGDGTIAFIFIVVLFWISFREALTFLSITLLITILVTILKNVIFPGFSRPVAYFEPTAAIRLVTGYNPPVLGTFPSGHTATAFSVCFYLSILSKSQVAKFFLFVTAFLVAYSRIYLSAHFPVDVVVGAAISVSVTIVCYYFSRKILNLKLDKKLTFNPKFLVRQQHL